MWSYVHATRSDVGWLCVQITSTMSKFEGLFEDLDVHTQVMDSAMSTATTLSTPESQVDSLMKQVRSVKSELASTSKRFG